MLYVGVGHHKRYCQLAVVDEQGALRLSHLLPQMSVTSPWAKAKDCWVSQAPGVGRAVASSQPRLAFPHLSYRSLGAGTLLS